MKVLAVILLMTGAAFLIMGAFIFFGKRYSLINGFDADLKAHRRDEKYAERVGIAELAVGTVLTAVGAVLIFFVIIPLTHHKNSGYTELKVLGVYFPSRRRRRKDNINSVFPH